MLLILTAVLATLVAAAVFLYLAATQGKRAAKTTTLPRGYAGPFAARPPDRKMPAARDAFKPRKVPEDLDFVIIGSGIGGMYTAALLAKVGKKVLVLEQHYIAGGCMHCFDDKGFEFDTGVHYVGKVEKYGMLLNMVTEEGVAPVEWAQMGTEVDGFVYDEIHVGTAPFKLPAGREKLLAALVERFPQEEAAIRKYLEACVVANKAADIWFFSKIFPTWLQRLCLSPTLAPFLNAKHYKYARRTAEDVIRNECGVKSDELYALLCGQFGDYGMLPSECSFFVHAGTAAHYFNGGYYPVGGPQKIVEALIPTVERAGGRVLVKASATSLLVEGGRCVGVVVNGDETVRAKNVVVAAGCRVTLQLLRSVGSEAKVPWAPLIEGGTATATGGEQRLGQGISHMYAFIGLDGTADELELRSQNLWVLPMAGEEGEEGSGKAKAGKFDFEGRARSYYASPDAALADGKMLMFMGFPSAKDPSFGTRHPGKSTCVIITEARREWFAEWEESGGGASGKRRSPEYDARKAQFEAQLLAGLHAHFPKTKGRVSNVQMASPLTNEHYLKRAASYGLEPTPARYTCAAAATIRPAVGGVPGLWLSGHDLTTAGWAGALSAGIVTAMAALGYGFWDAAVCGRDLIEDLTHLPHGKGAPVRVVTAKSGFGHSGSAAAAAKDDNIRPAPAAGAA